ncbi:hypothetical protein EIK77_009214 [Talaromyces pinophilus]|nr:hypothetical protein EIK77_009214 [Talaromyces pinophilus]
MEKITKVADMLLQQLQNNPKDMLNISLQQDFIRRVRDFASSQGERTDALADFKRLLEGIQQDTAVLRAQSTQSSNSATTGLSNDSAAQWRSHNAQRWQADLRHAVPPISQSAGSSTPGVTHEELGMDCEVVVKIRDEASKKLIRTAKPAEIGQRAERARKGAAKKETSLALSGHFFVAAPKVPKKRGKAAANTTAKTAAKEPTNRTTKCTKTTTQDNAEPAQPATQAMPATELVTGPIAEAATQPMAQAQSIEHITQPITQLNPGITPTAVRVAHRDAQPAQLKNQENQEKRGRGRPPKSKASSNGEQQQQQAPFSSVEAAIASAEAMMENARMEAESYESLVSTVANNPPPDGGWETITRPQRRRTPPEAQEHTTTLTKKLTPINKVRKPVQGPPRSPNYMMTRRRAREQSQESDGAPLPPQPTITARVEGNNTILTSSAVSRSLTRRCYPLRSMDSWAGSRNQPQSDDPIRKRR